MTWRRAKGCYGAFIANSITKVISKVSLLGFPVELPDEEEVPGFRMNADGSIRDTKAPAGWLYPDIRNNPFYPFDQPSLGANAVMPIGDGSPSPYLAYVRELYNGLGGAPTLGADAVQPSMPPFAPPHFGGVAFQLAAHR